jgi:hypothetical protein
MRTVFWFWIEFDFGFGGGRADCCGAAEAGAFAD